MPKQKKSNTTKQLLYNNEAVFQFFKIDTSVYFQFIDYQTELKKFAPELSTLYEFGCSWKEIYDLHFEEFTNLSKRPEIKNAMSEQELVVNQSWNEKLQFENYGLLYLYHIKKVPLPLAIAGSSTKKLTVKDADTIAPLLLHPAMSFAFARCVSYMTLHSLKEVLLILAENLLDETKKLLGTFTSHIMFNKWFGTGNQYPKHNHEGNYSCERYQNFSNITNDMMMVDIFLKNYKKSEQFYLPFKECEYDDQQLKDLMHHRIFTVEEIADEAMKRTTSETILPIIKHCCPSNTVKNRFEKYLFFKKQKSKKEEKSFSKMSCKN